ncbi:MAG: sensor domain-containing diguanylate cyclase [Chloroflexota bacterium]|nr:MAG: sensor domain-containing diguanylate cyclase [Chloroflexota bacterium]
MSDTTTSPLVDAPPAAVAAGDGADDSPPLGRRLRLAVLAPLLAIPGRPRRHVTSHGRMGTTAAAELLGLQRAMLWLRAFGILVVLGVSPAVSGARPEPIIAGTAALALVVALQLVAIRDARHDRLRAVAILGLVGDSVAAYLLGQAFISSPEWAQFAAYPLLAMEGAVILGGLGAAASTVASSAAFIAQYAERVSLGLASGPGLAVVVLAIFAITGVFSATYAGLSRRMRGDLTALLEVSSLLAQQETPTRIVQALDTRLRELVGARIRSFAVRRPDGGYDILRWRTPETRVVSHEAVRRLSFHLGHDIEAEVRMGRAMTIVIESARDEPVVTALGLPDWVRAITLVPIASDKLLSGILPVLWDSPHVPSAAELDLLNGFAQQTGLAFEQAQLRRARELAATDSLTGLANHRAFRDALAARMSESRRHASTFSILFCDLDRFKAVNDRHGHAIGDLLLHRVATAIRTAARSEDMVARYGGDEIALLLPGTGLFGALDLARRLREAVLSADIGMGIDLTVGVAVYPEDAADPESLIARADAAMYAGKRLGGARVVVASELPAEA